MRWLMIQRFFRVLGWRKQPILNNTTAFRTTKLGILEATAREHGTKSDTLLHDDYGGAVLCKSLLLMAQKRQSNVF